MPVLTIALIIPPVLLKSNTHAPPLLSDSMQSILLTANCRLKTGNWILPLVPEGTFQSRPGI